MALLAAFFIFTLPLLLPGVPQQDTGKTDSPALSLQQLGLSASWGECGKALAGTKAVFRFRSRTSDAEFVDGIVKLTWTASAIRIERIEHQLGKEDNVLREVEEYYPLRGEYVGYQSRPGWADSAFIACMRTPPPLAATLLGLMNPALRSIECQISPQPLQVSVSGESEEANISIVLSEAATAIPALWTISTSHGTERILYSTPISDPDTGRIVPGLIVKQELINGVVHGETVWHRADVEEVDELTAVINRRALITDLRTPNTNGVVPIDRDMPLENLGDWLAAPIWRAPETAPHPPLPSGEVMKGSNSVSKRQELQETSTTTPASFAQGAFSELIESATKSLRLVRSASPIGKTSMRVAGLPSIAGSSLTSWELSALNAYGSASANDIVAPEPTAAGNARGPHQIVPEARRVVLDREELVLTKDGTELTAYGQLAVSANSTDSSIRLIGSRSQCGVELIDNTPLTICRTPCGLSFKRHLGVLLPKVEYELVTLLFSDGSERRVAVRTNHGDAPVTFVPESMSPSGGDSSIVAAYSSQYSISAWTWRRLPPCLAMVEENPNEGEHSWVLVGTEASTTRHKCRPLTAHILVTSASGLLLGQELQFDVQLPIAHSARLKNTAGATIYGGVFRRGERIALIKSVDGTYTLWCPDRIVQTREQLLIDAEAVYMTTVPRDQPFGQTTWSPVQQPSIAVSGTISGDLESGATQWMHGAVQY